MIFTIFRLVIIEARVGKGFEAIKTRSYTHRFKAKINARACKLFKCIITSAI